MKYISFLLVVFVACVPVYAYQVGATNRTNFGSAQQQAQPQQNNYRAFSNYNNRSWGQGVQTQTVQTSVAGSSSHDLSAKPQQSVGKHEATASTTTGATSSAANNIRKEDVKCENGKCKGALHIPRDADPAAAAQQIQNIMNEMKAATGGNLNVPDFSALTGGNNAQSNGQVPAVTPAKK